VTLQRKGEKEPWGQSEGANSGRRLNTKRANTTKKKKQKKGELPVWVRSNQRRRGGVFWGGGGNTSNNHEKYGQKQAQPGNGHPPFRKGGTLQGGASCLKEKVGQRLGSLTSGSNQREQRPEALKKEGLTERKGGTSKRRDARLPIPGGGGVHGELVGGGGTHRGGHIGWA